MSERPSFQYPGDDPFTKRLTVLAQYQESLVETALQGDRSVKRLIEATRKGQLVADSELDQLYAAIADAAKKGLATKTACKAGCAHCCRRAPEATLPEVLVAVRHVEENFGDAKKAALAQRIANYVEETAPLRPGRLGESHAACPYLENDLCTIYPARPLSCRGLNSLDSQVCERISKGDPAGRPSLTSQLGIASAMRTGARLGLIFESADASTLDLGYATHIAMTTPSAAEDSLDGKDPFTAARLPYDLEAFDPGDSSMMWTPAFRSESELAGPSGNLPLEIIAQHKKFVDLAMGARDFRGALSAFQGSHVAHAIARIDVPRVFASEAEIAESREAFVAALRAFENAAYPPAEAFDALSIHQTMNLTYQGLDDLEIMKTHGRLMVEGITKRCLPDLTEPIKAKLVKGKLRVGYISANLNRSNGGQWALGWVKNHGPEIETFCFLLGWRSDSVTAAFKETADHFYWLTRSVPENARFIKALGLDVLIFTDIGLHARSTQYSALRLAPVQCTAWGHPDTTGLSTIDYYISSEMMEPENGQDYYSEKLVRLPRTGLCYPRLTSTPSSRGRAHFGIPQNEKLLFMGQTNLKMLPQHDRLYAEICRRVGAPLVLLESSSAGDSIVLKERLKKAGVPTRWLPYQQVPDYLELMSLADVSLDTPLWSGGNSTIQALTFGTPVVAIPGPFMRGRHSYAMLQIANAPGLIAEDFDDYIDLACDFDRQKDAMKNMDPAPLYDDVDAVRALDEFLWKAASGKA